MPRIFVAIPVAGPVRAALGRLRRHPAPALRWVAEHQYHITLKFLGDVDEAGVAAVHEAVAQAVAATPLPRRHDSTGAGAEGVHAAGLHLVARGIGAFPSPRRARVVWAGVAGEAEALVRLQAAVADRLSFLPVDADEKPFTPHITVARSRRPGPLPAALQTYADHEFGRWRADAVEVVESRLQPTGPRYIVRHRVLLGS